MTNETIPGNMNSGDAFGTVFPLEMQVTVNLRGFYRLGGDDDDTGTGDGDSKAGLGPSRGKKRIDEGDEDPHSDVKSGLGPKK